jgi:hypothetical protein
VKIHSNVAAKRVGQALACPTKPVWFFPGVAARADGAIAMDSEKGRQAEACPTNYHSAKHFYLRLVFGDACPRIPGKQFPR